jgi:hypothetical protein
MGLLIWSVVAAIAVFLTILGVKMAGPVILVVIIALLALGYFAVRSLLGKQEKSE